MVYGLCGIWTVCGMDCVVFELCGVWTVWCMDCVVSELCGIWTVCGMDCVVHGLCGIWTVWYMCNELGVIWSISHKILKIITRSCIIIQTTNPVYAGNVIYGLHNYIYGLRAS